MNNKLIGKYVIVRADHAGAFAGILAEKDGTEVTLTSCRRIWYWEGAASLSQLANEGVSKPEECKFSVEVAEIVITGVIEIIPTTSEAEECIRGVPVWRV